VSQTQPVSNPALPADALSLRRNLVYALIGNGLLNLCRVLAVVILAKYASAAIQGTYTYASIALAAPVVLFCGLELRAAYVADAGGEFTFGTYRLLRYLGMAVAAVVLLVVGLWITRHDPDLARARLILAVCAGRVVFGLAEVYWGVYQRRERLDLLAWSNALRGVVLLVPFVALAVLAPRCDSPRELLDLVTAAVLAYVLGWAVVWLLFDRRKVRRWGGVDFAWDFAALARLARQTLPLGLIVLLINLCETLTQWYVKHAAGAAAWSELGYFGALRILTLGAMFVVVQLGTAAGNRLATYYQSDLPAFKRLAWRITLVAAAIGLLLVLAAWLFGAPLLRAMYTAAYAEHARALNILVAGQSVALLAAVFGFITTHMRRFWIQVPIHLGVLAATGLAGYVLIGADDPVLGGAWTTFVRNVTQAVLYLACVWWGVVARHRAPQTPTS